ncbi:MAG: glutathione S-transferase family protein [Proteobacteria bacterium]|nr:MAG: glutathione S-transferase family protein [Pseudomonadota bacterium]
MGLLVDGVWQDQWYDTSKTGGRFERKESAFRDTIAKEDAKPGRYHLYVSYACPWAHRTLIARTLKKLEDVISFSAVEPLMLENGWTFAQSGELSDPLYQERCLHQIYTRANPTFTGRVTVPVLWDKEKQTIVNNESAEILRILDTAFEGVAPETPTLDPEELRAEMEPINQRIYDTLNNGVYKCGFATKQEAYEEAFGPLFDTLDWLEERLSTRRWLMGKTFTLADIRLFTTLVRFDAVYYSHFKCNQRRIEDYPHLAGYLREIYQLPGVAETTLFAPIKEHYYGSHKTINPTGIVPVGPALDFGRPHDRATL